MTKKTTELSTAIPACYCCLRETNLTEHQPKRLAYHTCDECKDAKFEKVDGLYVFVCPNHGIQHHYDIENYKFNERYSTKKRYWYPYPVHTRRTKENGLKPIFGLAKYDEVKL